MVKGRRLRPFVEACNNQRVRHLFARAGHRHDTSTYRHCRLLGGRRGVVLSHDLRRGRNDPGLACASRGHGALADYMACIYRSTWPGVGELMPASAQKLKARPRGATARCGWITNN
jgi:hypothetical protein